MSDPRHLVSKVHPATREVGPEDPFELYATPAPGEPEVLLRCLVQEYAWMGWDAEKILALFGDPFYPALHGLLELYGAEGVRRRVEALLGRTGVLHVRATVQEAHMDEDDGPELIQIGNSCLRPATARAERSCHAERL
jgi:hypothetical protein